MSQVTRDAHRRLYGIDQETMQDFLRQYAFDLEACDVYLTIRFLRVYSTHFSQELETEFDVARRRRLGTQAATRRAFQIMEILKPRILESFTFDISVCSELDFPLYHDAPFLLDGTHCPLANFSKTQAQKASYRFRFHSWKTKGMAVAYQVVYNPWSSSVCSMFGPVPGSVHDSIIYKGSGVAEHLEGLGKRCLADGGYAGCGRLIIPFAKRRRLEASEEAHNYDVSTCRWQVETLFSRMKSFRALGTPWRHHVSRHHLAFIVILGLVQEDLKRHPLEKVTEEDE